MPRFKSLSTWAARLRGEVVLLWYAARDPECPPSVRWVALGLVAYALSPIDLIPDFIPLVGWLDELVILPLGLAWLMKRLPPAVRARAAAQAAGSAAPQWAGQAERLGRWARRGLWLMLGIALTGVLLLGLLAWGLFRLVQP